MGRGTSPLRYPFERIGGEAKDQVAVDPITGHIRDDTASVHCERIMDERRKAVGHHVRGFSVRKRRGRGRRWGSERVSANTVRYMLNGRER